MKYRSDIDGLRAVAVSSVILAHAGVPLVKGGFLGVDVFFVISGYLITTILKSDLEQGRFSLARFYERRARRIFPALVPVIAFCVPMAMWLMLPDFLQNFGQSVVATLLFANNILLALTSGYWELESSFKPLLHTWSLGVEEQFYLVFPLLLALVWRFGRRAQVLTIVGLGLVSFALSEVGWRTYPDVSFYLPVTRAWELMVGCAAAYVERRPRPTDMVATLASLVALIAPMFAFTEHTPSPSFYSAVPVLGTVGIILFNRPDLPAYRLLSLRPVVFVGLISYSAYLWHQPLFAFARIASLTPPDPGEVLLLVVLTLVMATLSWKFVEQPFRRSDGVRLRVFVPTALATMGALVAVGLTFHFAQGFPKWTFPNIGRAGDVYISYNERVRKFSRTEFPADGKANVMVVGDSFGRDVANILTEAGALDGKNLAYSDRIPDCPASGDEFAQDAALYRQATVIVVALHHHTPECAAAIDRALAAFGKAPVVYFGSKDFGYNINPFGRVPMDRRPTTLAEMPPAEIARNDALRETLGQDRFVDLVRTMGPDGRRLRYFDGDGNPMTPDRMHLTRYGAVFAARALNASQPPAFRAIAGAAPQDSATALGGGRQPR